MQPFNYLGQDSGTLFYYYSGILRDGHQKLEQDYVILYGNDGSRLIYVPYGTPIPDTQIISESVNYSVVLGGDFQGSTDESVYSLSVKSGDIKPAYNDPASLDIGVSGEVSGIGYDRPTYRLDIVAGIETGDYDKPVYSLSLRSGIVSMGFADKSWYQMVVHSGEVSGAIREPVSYRLQMFGKMDKIQHEFMNLQMEFSGGALTKGNSVFSLSSGDSMGISFEFSNGMFYKS